jgi:hypothetical protein
MCLDELNDRAFHPDGLPRPGASRGMVRNIVLRALIGGRSRVGSHFGIRTICVKCNKRILRRRAIITCLPIAALIAFIAYEHFFAQASYPASDTNLKGGLRRRLRGFNQGDCRSTANDVLANHLTAALSPRYPAIVTASASH